MGLVQEYPFGKGLAIGLISLAALVLIAASRLKRWTSPYPLPPGPLGEPILGHLRTVPTDLRLPGLRSLKLTGLTRIHAEGLRLQSFSG
jgi:hypothetical protein